MNTQSIAMLYFTSICHCISSNIGRVHISPIIISSSVIKTLYIAELYLPDSLVNLSDTVYFPGQSHIRISC